jgi:hypothetical protein
MVLPLYVFHIRFVVCVYDLVGCPDSSVTIVPGLFRFLSRSKRLSLGSGAPSLLSNWYRSRAPSSLLERGCASTPPTCLHGMHRHSCAISTIYLTTMSVIQNSMVIGEYVTEITWKGSGRSLLELPSGRDTAQHSRPAGEHATATFLANFVYISYQFYACCMSYPRSSEHFVIPSC